MTTEELKLVLSTPPALFVLMLLASLSSGLIEVGKAKRAGADATFSSYLTHWPSLVGTFLGNIIAFAVLILTDQLNFASALGIGYGVNNVVDALPRNDRADSLVKQAGFARVPLLAAIAVLVLLMSGCATHPVTGDRALSPAGEQLLRTTARIAVRRSVLASPRAVAKARNIREIVAALGPLEEYSTVNALRAAVDIELDKLGLSSLDRMDANDMLDTFEQLLRQQISGDAIAPDGIVKIADFVEMIVAALPAV